MQEEIEQKSFNIMISTTKLSARTVLRADSFVVEIIMLNDFCSISSCTAITSRAAG